MSSPIWKKIEWAKYEHFISSEGVVFKIKSGKKVIVNSHIAKVNKYNKGYKAIAITDKNRKCKRPYLHRLMAEYFIPNPENKPQVNHKDGDTFNNCLENLEWCTAKENIRHAWDTGLCTPHSSVKSRLRITDEQAERIKRYVDSFMSIGGAARQMGINPISLENLISKKVASKSIVKKAFLSLPPKLVTQKNLPS